MANLECREHFKGGHYTLEKCGKIKFAFQLPHLTSVKMRETGFEPAKPLRH